GGRRPPAPTRARPPPAPPRPRPRRASKPLRSGPSPGFPGPKRGVVGQLGERVGPADGVRRELERALHRVPEPCSVVAEGVRAADLPPQRRELLGIVLQR